MREYINEIIWAIICGIMAFFVKKYNELKNKSLATQNGVKALLRAKIVDTYDKQIELGFMPVRHKENIQELYKEYKNLGGNGVIDHLIEELYDLPIDKR